VNSATLANARKNWMSKIEEGGNPEAVSAFFYDGGNLKGKNVHIRTEMVHKADKSITGEGSDYGAGGDRLNTSYRGYKKHHIEASAG